MKLWWDNGYTIHIHCNGRKGLPVILDTLAMLETALRAPTAD